MPELVESVEPDRITITLEIELCDRAIGNVANNVANVANNVANKENDVANKENDVANDENSVASDENVVADSRELSELEKSIFNFITSHINASTKDIAEAVGVTVRTVQRSKSLKATK